MLKKIEEIRQKPQSIRNRYAFLIAFFITSIIAGFWATTIPARLSQLPLQQTQVQEQKGKRTELQKERSEEGGFSHMINSLRASVFNSLTRKQDTKSEINTQTPENSKKDESTQQKQESSNTEFSSFFEKVRSYKSSSSGTGQEVLIATSSSDKQIIISSSTQQ